MREDRRNPVPRLAGAKQRQCLRCQQPFNSTGSANRIFPECSKKAVHQRLTTPSPVGRT